LTTTQLLILIGILAMVRGVFLLFPGMQVRSLILKICLLGCLGGAAWYFLKPDVLERIPFPARVVVLIAAFLAILFQIPRGTLDEQQKKTLLEYIDSVIIAGVTALILIQFVVRSFYIPSGSMLDTLQIYDMILVNELVYRFYEPGRGEVVVFHPPDKAHSEGKDYIKRVVALEGETVEVRDDVVYVNGKPLEESYKKVENPDTAHDYDPYTIPPGHVFVMGDNRHNSQDSREWGPLPKENIIGRAFLIFYPLNRIQMLH